MFFLLYAVSLFSVLHISSVNFCVLFHRTEKKIVWKSKHFVASEYLFFDWFEMNRTTWSTKCWFRTRNSVSNKFELLKQATEKFQMIKILRRSEYLTHISILEMGQSHSRPPIFIRLRFKNRDWFRVQTNIQFAFSNEFHSNKKSLLKNTCYFHSRLIATISNAEK